MITTVIEEVGAKNVVQILIDSAKNCKNANKILKRQYPHVYPSICTHGMNLVSNYWYKNDDTQWFASIIDTTCQLMRFMLKR